MKIEKLLVYGVLIGIAYYIFTSMNKGKNGKLSADLVLSESEDQEGLPDQKSYRVVGGSTSLKKVKCCSRDGGSYFTYQAGNMFPCGDGHSLC